jgi:hypothetical protein
LCVGGKREEGEVGKGEGGEGGRGDDHEVTRFMLMTDRHQTEYRRQETADSRQTAYKRQKQHSRYVFTVDHL